MEKQKRIDTADFDNKFTGAFAVFGWTFVILFFPGLCGMIFASMFAGNPFCGCMKVINQTQNLMGGMLLLLSPVASLVSAAIFSYQTIIVKGIKRSIAVRLTVFATTAVLILMLFAGNALLDASYGY